jgi:hypothetical protein
MLSELDNVQFYYNIPEQKVLNQNIVYTGT